MSMYPHRIGAESIITTFRDDTTIDVLSTSGALISQIDAVIVLAVGHDEDSVAYFVEYAEFTPFDAAPVTVKPDTDPALWELVRRHVQNRRDAYLERAREIVSECEMELAS